MSDAQIDVSGAVSRVDRGMLKQIFATARPETTSVKPISLALQMSEYSASGGP
jgi:hypothetical protein